MQQLVEATGVSRSSLYDAFGDKDGLFDEALKCYQGRTSKVLIERLQHTATPRETIIEVFSSAIHEACKSSDRVGCFMLNTYTEAQLRERSDLQTFLYENQKEVLEAITSTIRRGQQMGEINAGIQPKITAEMIYALQAGLMMMSRVDEKASCLEQAMKSGLDRLLGPVQGSNRMSTDDEFSQ